MREQPVFPDSRRPGLCFHCRKSGYWKKDCPELTRQTNTKITNLENQNIYIQESKSNDILKSNGNGSFQEVQVFSNEAVNTVNETDSDGMVLVHLIHQ